MVTRFANFGYGANWWIGTGCLSHCDRLKRYSSDEEQRSGDARPEPWLIKMRFLPGYR
jgi:hypothetical protein